MSRSRTSEPAAAWLAVLAALVAGPPATAAVTVLNQWAEAGRVTFDNGAWRVVFARGSPGVRVQDLSSAAQPEAMVLVPIGQDSGRAVSLGACSVGKGSADQTACHTVFAAKGGSVEADFVFSSTGAVKVLPSPALKAIAVSAAFRYAVLPSRLVDDNLYDAADYPKLARLAVPPENMLLGLVEGGAHVIALVWPSGEQSAAITLSTVGGKHRIEALEVGLGGRELHVGALRGAGIWYEKALDPSFEEQDVALDWKPPFEATWKTQLTELGVPTTFRWARERLRPWRPTIGFYIYPFFTEKGKVILHLHKKLACEGRAVIYALEGHEQTPYAFLTRNLPLDEQRKVTELQPVGHYYVLDPSPVPGGLLMNAHCAGRDQLKNTTFAVGAQTREAAFLDTHIMERAHECEVIATYHVQRSLNCMGDLSDRLDVWIKQESGDPGVAAYLRGLRDTLSAMQRDYREHLGGRTPEDIIRHAREVAEKFRVVIREDAGCELCPEAMSYINDLNGVISLEEDQGRRFGTWARKLLQQAASAGVAEPKAAGYGRQIRSVLREHLRYRQYEAPGTAGNPGSLLPAK